MVVGVGWGLGGWLGCVSLSPRGPARPASSRGVGSLLVLPSFLHDRSSGIRVQRGQAGQSSGDSLKADGADCALLVLPSTR